MTSVYSLIRKTGGLGDWGGGGSNQRPLVCKVSILITAPRPHFWILGYLGLGILKTIVILKLSVAYGIPLGIYFGVLDSVYFSK